RFDRHAPPAELHSPPTRRSSDLSPARSSTFRCLEMAGWLISNGSASSVTVASPSASRARSARRVGSARAAKVRSSRSGVFITIRFNNTMVIYNGKRSPSSVSGHGFRPAARERSARRPGSVVVAAVPVHVAVLEFLGAGLAHLDDLDVEVQVLARHRMVEVDVDHAHAHLLDGHRTRTEVGVEHHLHAGFQALAAEMLLRHALGQALALLAIGLGGGDVDAELLAGL